MHPHPKLPDESILQADQCGKVFRADKASNIFPLFVEVAGALYPMLVFLNDMDGVDIVLCVRKPLYSLDPRVWVDVFKPGNTSVREHTHRYG